MSKTYESSVVKEQPIEGRIGAVLGKFIKQSQAAITECLTEGGGKVTLFISMNPVELMGGKHEQNSFY